MGKHAQLVMGPAGSGKSTYCQAIQKYCFDAKRHVHVVNLDPAAENFNYDVAIDIRDLISLEDVMEELDLGPNGGLVYCMEYLVEHIDWLTEQIADYGDDYLIFDCPGQIELFFHLPVMKKVQEELARFGYQTCAVYLIDSLVVSDASRFIAGTLMCLAAMVNLELPHINLLTKCDMVQNKTKLEEFFNPDVRSLTEELNKGSTGPHKRMNEAVGTLIEEYSMVSFLPFDITDQDSIMVALSHIDNAIQYGEDLEPQEPGREPEDSEEQQPDLSQYHDPNL